MSAHASDNVCTSKGFCDGTNATSASGRLTHINPTKKHWQAACCMMQDCAITRGKLAFLEDFPFRTQKCFTFRGGNLSQINIGKASLSY